MCDVLVAIILIFKIIFGTISDMLENPIFFPFSPKLSDAERRQIMRRRFDNWVRPQMFEYTAQVMSQLGSREWAKSVATAWNCVSGTVKTLEEAFVSMSFGKDGLIWLDVLNLKSKQCLGRSFTWQLIRPAEFLIGVLLPELGIQKPLRISESDLMQQLGQIEKGGLVDVISQENRLGSTRLVATHLPGVAVGWVYNCREDRRWPDEVRIVNIWR